MTVLKEGAALAQMGTLMGVMTLFFTAVMTADDMASLARLILAQVTTGPDPQRGIGLPPSA